MGKKYSNLMRIFKTKWFKKIVEILTGSSSRLKTNCVPVPTKY